MTKPVSIRSVIVIALLLTFGCSKKQPLLMPTPNLYTHPAFNPFADVPPPLQSNRVQVLYMTDRTPQKDKDGNLPPASAIAYGHERSRSAAFGVAEFQVGGDDLTWDELVAASRTQNRAQKLIISVPSVRELGRFPQTPPSLIYFGFGEAGQTAPPDDQSERGRVKQAFLEQLTAQLALTPRKEVFLFIHGFNVSFEGSVLTTGELWHFLGHEGVPVAYSWPAGQGTLRAYEYTNQSVRFTIHHLKQTILMIASCPEVEKINIIAHSRGTAVVTDAVRELCFEIRGKGDLAELKLGSCVLAAADIDFDAAIEQNVTARVGEAVEATAVYDFEGDKALAFSNWLAGGMMRLGDARTNIFTPEEIHALRRTKRLQFVNARITKPGSMGHNYFHANPAVSSDLVLFLRYNLPPGGEYGRPLEASDTGFWILDDDYPGSLDAPWFQRLQRPEPVATGRSAD